MYRLLGVYRKDGKMETTILQGGIYWGYGPP